MSRSGMNAYERAGELVAEEERQRLRSFDVPTRDSITVLSTLNAAGRFLDIGAGENPGMQQYVGGNHGTYFAVDIRENALREQQSNGALAIKGSALKLPVADGVMDIAHTRFVLTHFLDEGDRRQIIQEAFRTVALGGAAVFMDYDWDGMHGSLVIERFRDFNIARNRAFSATYGAQSFDEVERALHGDTTNIETTRLTHPVTFDYQPALRLRGLIENQLSGEDIQEAVLLFDALEAEAASESPPGFIMPDIVAVVAFKE